MRLALTGSNGLLGSRIKKIAMSHGVDIKSLSRGELNPQNGLESIVDSLREIKSEVLVHCAANTDVEKCEKEPEFCYRDNTLLTELLAIACRIIGIKMVFISSTGIYGTHKKTAYHEYDQVRPTTVHHNSKWQAEKLIQSQLRDCLIIRTGWLFGGEWDMSKNFVANRIRECLTSNGQINSDATQFGNPTFVDDVADRVLTLIKMNISGVFNCVNLGVANRYDYVKEIVRCAELDVKVIASDSPFQREAKVSFNESASNFKMDELGLSHMPSWNVSLAEYICKLKGNW